MPSKVDNTTSDRSGMDISNEVQVKNKDVKLYKIEELAPSSVPITIPYMEVYRTNELEYIPYISPFNVGASSSDSDSDSSSGSGSSDSSDSSGSDSGSDSGDSGTGSSSDTGTDGSN